jgi:endonuclease/exonuclease/phosphatase (EEP) superfamily protein YafD
LNDSSQNVTKIFRLSPPYPEAGKNLGHSAPHGFPDATFDFIFAKGLTMLQPTIIQTNASDHWPVTRTFALH